MESLRQERTELQDQVEQLQSSGQLKVELPSDTALSDLEEMRDRILASLGRGKQSPEYKRTKAALDRFIRELKKNDLQS